MAGKNGGARPGAGRPKGSTSLPRFSDYTNDAERRKFAEFVHETYMGDMRLAIFYGQNAFAKPVEHIDHTTMGEKLPTPLLANVPTDDSTQEDTKA